MFYCCTLFFGSESLISQTTERRPAKGIFEDWTYAELVKLLVSLLAVLRSAEHQVVDCPPPGLLPLA